MKINPHSPLFAAVAAESSGLGMAAAPSGMSTPPPPAAEAPKPTTRADLEAHLSPEARKVLKDRLSRKPKTDPTTPPPANDEARAKAEADAAAAAAKTAADKSKETPKPGEEAKHDEPSDADVIDFTKLKAPEKPDGEDGAPVELTAAELADIEVIKAKLTEAHKDNAAQRKLKRELKEAKEKLEADNKALSDQLDTFRAQAQGAKFGKYLDKAASIEQAQQLKADAVETLRQLQEKPDTETILLPGNRTWKIVDAEGNHFGAHIAQDAIDIIDGYDGKIKQLSTRGAAEKVVNEHLPLLSKAVPEIEKSYKELLASDWSAAAPQISLDAALGKLVREGRYVMMPAGKQAAPKGAPAAKPKPAAPPELPNTPPPVREAKAGEQDISHFKERAMKGDQNALREWIKRSGTTKAA